MEGTLILHESMSSKAWMLRNDNKYIPVTQHIYANPEDIFETLYAAEWLYNNTQFKESKILTIDLIAAWVRSFAPDSIIKDEEKLLPVIIQEIKEKPFKFISTEFIKNNFSQIFEASQNNLLFMEKDKLCQRIADALNQEFLRARFGGMYNSNTSSKEMYFRISSVNFNWFNIIWEFVYNNRNNITSVTVVRDEEATGSSQPYIIGGAKILNMPVDDFINISGNPVLEFKIPYSIPDSEYSNVINLGIYKSLEEGKSTSTLYFNLGINAERLDKKLEILKYKENLLLTYTLQE